MYLKAIWLLHESGEKPVRIKTVSRVLDVASPSVVQMLTKLAEHGFLQYLPRQGGVLTGKGEEIGRRMVRNTRLVEVLMTRKFKIDVDERVACGIEHHMTDTFSESLCILLNHPATCPHGYRIPPGKCCQRK